MNTSSIARCMIILLFLFSVSTIFRCQDQEETEQQNNLFTEESPFLEEVSKSNYTVVEPKQESYKIRWNLQKENDYTYDFSQKFKMKIRSTKTSGNDRITKANSKGTLIVRSKGNGSANLIHKNFKFEMKLDENSEPKVISQPTIRLKGMDESGNFKDSSNKHTFRARLLKNLFPVPPYPIQKGESVRIDQTIPLKKSGMHTYFNGYSVISFTRMVEIDGNNCIQLDVKTDLSRQDLPDKLKGMYDLNATVESRYYFNLDKGVFQQGKRASLIKYKIDVPPPSNKGKQGNEPKNKLSRKMKVSIDHLVELKMR